MQIAPASHSRPVRGFIACAYRTAQAVSSRYSRHAGSQLAAGISYRVLFSLVPLVALLVSVLDLFLPSEARADVVDWLFHRFPGHGLESAVNKSVSHPGATAPLVGVVALAGLLWAASGMMASLRIAFRVVWEVPGPTYMRGKLRDFLLVGLAAALLLVAVGVSLAVQLVAEAGKGVSAARTTANSVYGPLGALFTFLLLIYLLGTVLLLGAELIAAGASRHKGRRTDAQRQLPPK